jgi:Trk K+ transport system NAD-binding subunit
MHAHDTSASARDPVADAQRPGVLIVGEGRLAEAVYERCADQSPEWIRPRDFVELKAQLGAALKRGPAAVLALSDSAEHNLLAAIEVAAADGDVAVVMRAFDPTLADEIERAGGARPLNVRRAYSMANLAAPAFVAAALLRKDEESLATVRVGDEYASVCRVRVRDARGRSRRPELGGLTPSELFARHRCQVLARHGRGSDAAADAAFAPGEELVLGGRLLDVLELARDCGPVGRVPSRRPRLARPTRRRTLRTAPARARSMASQLSTRVLTVLIFLVTLTAVLAPVRGMAAHFHTWALVALGNDPVQGTHSPTAGEATLAGLGVLAGGVALGLGISLLSAFFTDRRMTEAAYRQAERLRRHVIVVGLTDLGLRVARLLRELDVELVVLEPSERPGMETSARRLRLLDGAPVLSGALADTLPLARADRAHAVIACDDSDLVNVEACLRAKRAGGPAVRTIARIFEDAAREDIHVPLGVDVQLGAAQIAAEAFVDAARHPEAVRTFGPEEAPMTALRWPDGQPFGSRQMRAWHEHGVRLLAVWTSEERAQPPAHPCAGVDDEVAAVLVGPAAPMEAVIGELQRRTPRPRMRGRLHAVSDPG